MYKSQIAWIGYVVILISTIFSLKAQTVQWAQKGISPGYEYGNAITTDDSGNAYIAGQIEYTTQFNGISLTSNGIHDILVGKFGPDGSIKWLHHAGGPGGDVGYGVGVDANHNTYLSGEVELTSVFGSGYYVTSAGSNDVFLAKYGIGGNVLWVKRWGSASNDKSRALAVAPNGDCYLAGYFSDNTTFGSFTLANTSPGTNDMFVAKINASGDVLWAKKGGGINDDRGYGITFDKSGNVFVAGEYFHSATFGSTTLSNNDTTSGYLAKYNSNGNLQWVKNAGSCCSATEFNCVTVDENGFIYAAGYFNGSGDYGSNHFTSAGSSDIVIVKYDQSGNVIWAKQAGGSSEDIAYGITVDTIAHLIYVTGQLDGHGYFGSHYVGSAGNRDVFIAAYDMNGNSVWAKPYGGNQRDIGYAIASDKSGNIFTTGVFTKNADFGSYNLVGDTLYDFYIDKVSPAPASQPTGQSSGLTLLNVNCGDLQLSFSAGNGDRRIVVAHANTTVNSFPVDGNVYSANSVFGNGSNLGNGNFVLYNGTGNNVTVTALNQGVTYYFSVFEYNGLGAAINYLTTSPFTDSATAGTASVSIHAAINILCAGDSVILEANGASLYNWLPLNGLSSGSGISVVASPLATTTYTVTGTDANGCQANSQITLLVNPNPVVTLLMNDSICLNSSPIVLSGGLPTNGFYNGTGVSAGAFDPSQSGAGSFMIQYYYTDSNGCTGNDSSTIVVNPLPIVSATASSPVCINGTPVTLNNGSPSGGIYSGNGIVSGTFDPTATGAGFFPVVYTFTDNHGCTDTSSFAMIVVPLPVVNLGTDTTICAGDIIQLTVGTGFDSYSWSTGETNQSINVDSDGTGIGNKIIFLEVSDSLGCSNSDTLNIVFTVCTGTEEIFNDHFGISIYPNPFSHQFTITTNHLISLSVYDDLGKLLFRKENVSDKIILGDDLKPGVYFIDMESGKGRTTTSVIKFEF